MKKGGTLLLVLGILCLLVSIAGFMVTTSSVATIVSVIFGILGFGLTAAALGRNLSESGKEQINLETFFTLGLIFLIVGLFAKTSAMWVLGLIFFLVGLGGRLGRGKKSKTVKKVKRKTVRKKSKTVKRKIKPKARKKAKK